MHLLEERAHVSPLAWRRCSHMCSSGQSMGGKVPTVPKQSKHCCEGPLSGATLPGILVLPIRAQRQAHRCSNRAMAHPQTLPLGDSQWKYKLGHADSAQGSTVATPDSTAEMRKHLQLSTLGSHQECKQRTFEYPYTRDR
eukprot:80406-Amphidinium_carterae.1